MSSITQGLRRHARANTPIFKHAVLSLLPSQLCFPTRKLGKDYSPWVKGSESFTQEASTLHSEVKAREETQLSVNHTSREWQTQLEFMPLLSPPPCAHTASWWQLAFGLGSKANKSSSVISHISYSKGEALVNYAYLDLVQHWFQQMTIKNSMTPA